MRLRLQVRAVARAGAADERVRILSVGDEPGPSLPTYTGVARKP
jgi:hypothetical protein